MKQRTIFYGENIITPISGANAVEVTEGVITAVGSYERLNKQNAHIIDLKDSTLMPGFIDAHSHFTQVANSMGFVSLKGCADFDEIIARIKSYIDTNSVEKGQWVIGFSYDHNELKERKHPDKAVLDKISTEHPIIISHASGHMGVAGSSALQIAGIDKNSNPDGGVVGKDDNGEPNGYLEETAFMQIASHMPPPDMSALMKNMEKAQELYFSHGITTAQDGRVQQQEFDLLKSFSKSGDLKLDVIGYVDLKNNKSIMDDNQQYSDYINHFRLGGYKIFLDGSPQGRTARMRTPYLPASENYCAYGIYSDQQVAEFINTADKEHKQLLTHCNGDRAVQQLLDCAPHATGYRNVIIHAQLLARDQLDRVKELQYIPSYFIAHIYYWGDVHIKNFGKDRADFISPANSTLNKDIVFTFHQDSPVIEPNMLETISCAVNRVTKDNIQLAQSECITPMQAINAVTQNAAYQYFEENIKGSITPGKKADMIILNDNPLKINKQDIKNIKVLRTYKDGNLVYER